MTEVRSEGWKSGGAGRVCCQGLEPRLEVGRADRGRPENNPRELPFHFKEALLPSLS